MKASDLELGFLFLVLFNPQEMITSLLNILPEIFKKTKFGC